MSHHRSCHNLNKNKKQTSDFIALISYKETERNEFKSKEKFLRFINGKELALR